MASTTALFTGLSGVLSHSRLLDVVGNNITNVNTTAFKSSRMLFAPTFSRTTGLGTPPGDATGGTNPKQVGLGVTVSATQRNFSDGGLSVTGNNMDLALEGEGMFIVETGAGRFYTRAGAFQLNAENELVTPTGARVQGFGVDANFQVQSGALRSVTVPLGELTIAEATANVEFAGNLNASGDVATVGSLIEFGALTALGSATPPPANPPYADATTRLVDLDDGTGSAQFAVGQTIRLTGAEKGGKTLADAELTIGAGTTVADFMAFLEEALGVETGVAGQPGGVSIDDTTGVLTVEGNFGTANDLVIDSSALVQLDANGSALGQPFSTSKTQTADGESVRTTFLAYDSLGTPLTVDLTMVLQETSDTGTTWRYYAESADSIGTDLRLGTGTLSFDTNGQIIEPGDFTISVSRDGTGANDPLTMTLSIASGEDGVTALADTGSGLAAVFQDGSPIGTLSDFGVGEDGLISGTFTNGLVRTIGQIAVATFSNPEGLADVGENFFAAGPNSGSPVISTPLSLGAGRVVSGALELSNVDLSQEFINLILASTGYSASSRVINTTNDLFQQLLLIGR